MQLVTIATFDDLALAQRLRERFAQTGLSTELQDKRKVQKFWFLSKPRAAIQVKVNAENYAAGEELYRQLDATGDPVLQGAIRCPQCRSSRIEYPQLARHSCLPTLVGHLGFLMGFHRQFYCEQCHYTWASKSRRETSSPQPALVVK
jgi:hypothetical protein